MITLLKKISLAVLVTALSMIMVQARHKAAGGIQFQHGSWNEALQQAKKENKLIFLDIYATWCGPCKRLKATTFSDKEVGSFYNAHFINMALDGEQGEGALLAGQYGLQGYPTLLFINAEGKIVNAVSGYQTPADLLQLGKSVAR